jgi:hypothetical protein
MSELKDIVTRLRAGKDPDTGELIITEAQALAKLQALLVKERIQQIESIRERFVLDGWEYKWLTDVLAIKEAQLQQLKGSEEN